MSTRQKQTASGAARKNIPATNFTLIELLVVIAIIAILASMLLPALGRARSRGKQAKCIGNLKQVASATMLYAGENQDSVLLKNNYDASKGWSYALLPYLGITQQSYGTEQSRDMLLCPAQQPFKWDTQYHRSYGVRYYDEEIPDGYRFNIAAKLYFLKINKIRDASKYLHAVDSVSGVNYYQAANVGMQNYLVALSYWVRGNGQYYGGAHLRHSNAANAMFIDGHAATVQRNGFAAMSSGIANGVDKKFNSAVDANLNEIKL